MVHYDTKTDVYLEANPISELLTMHGYSRTPYRLIQVVRALDIAGGNVAIISFIILVLRTHYHFIIS